MRATVRAYEPRDLLSILRLWEQAGLVPVGSDGLTLDQAVELIGSGTASTLVAERDGDVVGAALGGVAAAVGWIYRLSVPAEADGDEVAQQLLGDLELKLGEGGARKLVTAVRDGSAALAAFERHGYRTAPTMRYLDASCRRSGLLYRQPSRSLVHTSSIRGSGRSCAASMRPSKSSGRSGATASSRASRSG
jgi:Acetyltransferase (GNAT) family